MSDRALHGARGGYCSGRQAGGARRGREGRGHDGVLGTGAYRSSSSLLQATPRPASPPLPKRELGDIRSKFPSRVETNRALLDIVATVPLLITVLISGIVGWPAPTGFLGEIAVLSIVFTVAALALGRLTARVVRPPQRIAGRSSAGT